MNPTRKRLLEDVARQWANEEARGDHVIAANRARTFEEAGGFAGWDARGRMEWVLPDGGTTTDRRGALEAWARTSEENAR